MSGPPYPSPTFQNVTILGSQMGGNGGVQTVVGLSGNVTAAQIQAAINQVYIGVMTLTQPAAQQVFQRDTRTGAAFALGAGAITLTVNATQPIARLDYRLRNAASPATILQDWTFATGNLGDGALAITWSVPASLNWYLIDLRANSDNTSTVSTTAKVSVGEVVTIAGQSLAEAFLTTAVTADPATIAGLGVAISPYGVVYASYASNNGAYPPVADGADVNYPPAGWVLPADGSAINGTGVTEFLRLVVANTGVPCAVVGYAVGGTSIASWEPGYAGVNAGHWTKFVANVTAAGGKFAAILWDQGHYESKDGTTSAIYLAALQQLFAAITAQFPSAGAYKKMVATIPAIGTYGSGPSFIEMVRATAMLYVAGDANATYVDGLDATLWTDLVHPSQAGNIIYGRHFYRTFMAAIGLRGHGDHGPYILSAARLYNSVNLDLTVSQPNGGSALVGVGPYADQFQIFPAGAVTGAIAIASVDLTVATRIRIVLAAAPTEPAALDVWYRLSPDTATIVGAGIYDNVIDSDGLSQGRQVSLVAVAVSAAAPNYTITVTTPTISGPAASFTLAGTYTGGGLPTALDYSVDSGTNWLAAATPSISGGAYSFTISAGLPVGTYALLVRDHNATTTFGKSAVFSVAQASPPTLPVLSNQIFALDAANAAGGLFTDTGLTIQAVNGSQIAGIKDATANGNNFTQATATLRPTLAVNVKNSMPGIRFTGSLAQLLNQSGGTISNAIRQSSGYGYLCIFTPATLPGAAAQSVMEIGSAVPSSDADKTRVVQQLTSGILRTGRYGDTGLTSAATATGTAANTLVKAVSRWDGTNIKIAANAITEASAAITGAFTTVWTESSVIGNAIQDPFPFDGWIHEIRVWNTTVADADRTNLLTYATSKWGS